MPLSEVRNVPARYGCAIHKLPMLCLLKTGTFVTREVGEA